MTKIKINQTLNLLNSKWSVIFHVSFVLFIVCLYICVCECLLQNNNHKRTHKNNTNCVSAFEPGASGLPYYFASICVRSCYNWCASSVDSKPKKKKEKKKGKLEVTAAHILPQLQTLLDNTTHRTPQQRADTACKLVQTALHDTASAVLSSPTNTNNRMNTHTPQKHLTIQNKHIQTPRPQPQVWDLKYKNSRTP